MSVWLNIDSLSVPGLDKEFRKAYNHYWRQEAITREPELNKYRDGTRLEDTDV
jgi:hypothetical protein